MVAKKNARNFNSFEQRSASVLNKPAQLLAPLTTKPNIFEINSFNYDKEKKKLALTAKRNSLVPLRNSRTI
jgi:hypothetical protein